MQTLEKWQTIVPERVILLSGPSAYTFTSFVLLLQLISFSRISLKVTGVPNLRDRKNYDNF